MSEIDRWLANLELELSGASLNPLEGFVLGGDVFNLTELRGILTQAKEARRQALEEAAKVADDLGGGRIERNPDGSLRTYDMNCKHGRGDAVLNAMRVRAQTIAQAIRDMKDRT